MNFDYRNTPCYADSSLMNRLQECSDDLAKEYASQFNRWLGACISEFCPVVADWVERGDLRMAIEWLNREEYHYRCLPDGVTEFCQGETPLARAVFKFTFQISKRQCTTPAGRGAK